MESKTLEPLPEAISFLGQVHYLRIKTSETILTLLLSRDVESITTACDILVISEEKIFTTSRSAAVVKFVNLLLKDHLGEEDVENLTRFEVISKDHFASVHHYKNSKLAKKLTDKRVVKVLKVEKMVQIDQRLLCGIDIGESQVLDFCPGRRDWKKISDLKDCNFLAFHMKALDLKSLKWKKEWNLLEDLRESCCKVLKKKFVEFPKVPFFESKDMLKELLFYCEATSLMEIASDDVKLQKYYYFRHEVVSRAFHNHISGSKTTSLSRTDVRLEKLGLKGKGSELTADFVVKSKNQKMSVVEVGVSSTHGQKYYNMKVEKLKDAFDRLKELAPNKFEPAIAVLDFKSQNIFSSIFSKEEVKNILKMESIIKLSKIEINMNMSKKTAKTVLKSENFGSSSVIETLYKRSLGFLFAYNKKLRTHGLKGSSFKKFVLVGKKSLKRSLGKMRTVKRDREMIKLKELYEKMDMKEMDIEVSEELKKRYHLSKEEGGLMKNLSLTKDEMLTELGKVRNNEFAKGKEVSEDEIKKTDSKVPILNYSLNRKEKIPFEYFTSRIDETKFFYKTENFNPYKEDILKRKERSDERSDFINFGIGVKKIYCDAIEELLNFLCEDSNEEFQAKILERLPKTFDKSIFGIKSMEVSFIMDRTFKTVTRLISAAREKKSRGKTVFAFSKEINMWIGLYSHRKSSKEENFKIKLVTMDENTIPDRSKWLFEEININGKTVFESRFLTILRSDFYTFTCLFQKSAMLSKYFVSESSDLSEKGLRLLTAFSHLVLFSNNKAISTQLTKVRYIGMSLSSIVSYKADTIKMLIDSPIRTPLSSYIAKKLLSYADCLIDSNDSITSFALLDVVNRKKESFILPFSLNPLEPATFSTTLSTWYLSHVIHKNTGNEDSMTAEIYLKLLEEEENFQKRKSRLDWKMIDNFQRNYLFRKGGTFNLDVRWMTYWFRKFRDIKGVEVDLSSVLHSVLTGLTETMSTSTSTEWTLMSAKEISIMANSDKLNYDSQTDAFTAVMKLIKSLKFTTLADFSLSNRKKSSSNLFLLREKTSWGPTRDFYYRGRVAHSGEDLRGDIQNVQQEDRNRNVNG